METKLHPLTTYSFSVLVAALTAAVPNCCFQNAWEAVSALPQWFAGGSYVEGWLVLELAGEVLIIEHGWAQEPDARIVDPSIIFLVGPSHPLAYFPSVIYSRSEALTFRGQMLPHVWETMRDGDTRHEAASDQAWRLAQSLATASEKRLMVHRAKERF